MDQRQTPILDAIKRHISDQVTPFHVPGHKGGKGSKDLVDFLGEKIHEIDLNAMDDVDDLMNPKSCILESEQLIADAFSAEHAFMLTNGTSSGIQGMMLAVLKSSDKVILPRNVHKSVINGLILTGAIPHYVYPETNDEIGISTFLSTSSIEEAFRQEAHSIGTFLINPSYYGYASNIKEIIEIAHRHDSIVMVDEAHGCHMAFHSEFPISAMAAGADLAALSMHKTSGSLTQSSILLQQGKRLTREKLKQSLNLIRSTSASYPLMLSLELARKNLALNGKEQLEQCINLADYARAEINSMDALYAFSNELTGNADWISFDRTKLNIYVRKLGLTGFELERILRNEYRIQIELAELNTIMAIVSIADTKGTVDILLSALREISKYRKDQKTTRSLKKASIPKMIVSPRDAFYQEKKMLSLEQSCGEIAAEMIMAYPPGIPIICPGERISQDIIDYINLLKEENCSLQGNSDPNLNQILVLGK